MIGLMGYQNAIRDQLEHLLYLLNSISDDGQSLEAMAFNGCFLYQDTLLSQFQQIFITHYT